MMTTIDSFKIILYIGFYLLVHNLQNLRSLNTTQNNRISLKKYFYKVSIFNSFLALKVECILDT